MLFDQFESQPPGGYAEWSHRAAERADFVVMVCSDAYCEAAWPPEGREPKGPARGVLWEARLILQRAYGDGGDGRGVLPVFFDRRRTERLPLFLQGRRNFVLPEERPELWRALGLEVAGAPPPDTPRTAARRPTGLPLLETLGLWILAISIPAILLVAVLSGDTSASRDAGQDPGGPRIDVLDSTPLETSPLATLEIPVASTQALRGLTCRVHGTGEELACSEGAEGRYRITVPPVGVEGRHAVTWTATPVDGPRVSGTIEFTARYRSRAPRGCVIVVDEPGDAEGLLATRVRHVASAIELCLVPAGTYRIGSGEQDDEPLRNVHLPQPIYFGTTEVTVAAWRRFVASSGHRTLAEIDDSGGVTLVDGDWPPRNIRGAIWSDPLPYQRFSLDDAHPVTQVALTDAEAFCTAYGLRLPTETEWEVACRSGSTDAYWWGNAPEDAQGRANVGDRSLIPFYRSLQPFEIDDGHPFLATVGSFAPNAFGLHDMTGNVWEWCAPAEGDAAKRATVRGASWGSRPSTARAANRLTNTIIARSDSIGFRVVLDAF